MMTVAEKVKLVNKLLEEIAEASVDYEEFSELTDYGDIECEEICIDEMEIYIIDEDTVYIE